MSTAAGAIPVVGALDADSIWLTSTLVSVAAVLGFGIVAALFLYAARHFKWLTNARQLQLARTFRVAFGGLFLAAALLPYLIVEAPLLAVTSTSLFVLALIPILLTRSNQSGQYSEGTNVENLEMDS